MTTLMILSARCALMMLADLPHAALVGCRRERGRVGKVAAIAPDTHGDAVAAKWSVHVWHRNPVSGISALEMLSKP